jgi:hypothetical protein
VATRTLFANITGVGVLAMDSSTELVMRDSIVRGSLLGAGEHAVVDDISVINGAHALIERSVLERGNGAGLVAFAAGTAVDVRDLVVRDRVLAPGGRGSAAIIVENDARLAASGLAVHGVDLVGVAITNAAATIDELLVRDVHQILGGYGFGVVTSRSAELTLSRAAVEQVSGWAIALVQRGGGGVRFTATDLFIRDVRSSPVEYDPVSQTILRDVPPVALGVMVANTGTVTIGRATILAGGYGFLNAGGGINIDRAVIAAQLDAAGAATDAAGAARTTLQRVVMTGNARNELVVRPELPVGAALPLPSAPCLTTNCP